MEEAVRSRGVFESVSSCWSHCRIFCAEIVSVVSLWRKGGDAGDAQALKLPWRKPCQGFLSGGRTLAALTVLERHDNWGLDRWYFVPVSGYSPDSQTVHWWAPRARLGRGILCNGAYHCSVNPEHAGGWHPSTLEQGSNVQMLQSLTVHGWHPRAYPMTDVMQWRLPADWWIQPGQRRPHERWCEEWWMVTFQCPLPALWYFSPVDPHQVLCRPLYSLIGGYLQSTASVVSVPTSHSELSSTCLAIWSDDCKSLIWITDPKGHNQSPSRVHPRWWNTSPIAPYQSRWSVAWRPQRTAVN